MEWQTHMLSGVVAGFSVTGGDWKGGVIGAIAGVVPDLDEPKSKFGKIFFFFSVPISSFFEHRTFTHSLLFVLLMGLAFIPFFDFWVSLSIVAGILAHIAGDIVTGKVQLLYPLKKKIGIPIPFALFVPIDRVARLLLFASSLWFLYKFYI